MLNLPNKWNQVRLCDSPQEMMLFGTQVNQSHAIKTLLSDNNLNQKPDKLTLADPKNR
jgi:hypothetical protein